MISPQDARELGLNDGDEAALQTNGDEVTATVVVRTGVPPGSVFLTPAALEEGPVEIRAREAVAG
jgi:anaerobic selenocysteine-containing dehydrogenase